MHHDVKMLDKPEYLRKYDKQVEERDQLRPFKSTIKDSHKKDFKKRVQVLK